MAGIRTTHSRLLYSTALAGSIRVTKAGIMLVVSNPGKLRVTHAGLRAMVANPGPLRVTHVSLLRAQSLDRLFYLGRLNSTSTINDLVDGSWVIELVAGPIPEFNPYKPQVPESLIEIPGSGRDLFDYIEENQKTLRLQHNITQAGDTTFPFQMIINVHGEQQFTLGAIGKFYHEDFGIIHARYVQFEKMNPDVNPTAPVGLIRRTGKLDWVVTNRLELSSPFLCVGINSSYVMPTDGQYGWVTVDGVNLQALINTSTSVENGEAFVWSASGQVKNEGIGVVIARRVDETPSQSLLKGQAYVRIESASRDSFVASMQEFIDAVIQLREDVDNLQTAEDIEAFTAALVALQNQLKAETASRKAGDTALNHRIDNLDFVTDAELAQAVINLENEISHLHSEMLTLIAAVDAKATEALAKANQAASDEDLAALQEQITELATQLAALSSRAKGKFPVVDGSIPPNLVYLDSGELVYLETF